MCLFFHLARMTRKWCSLHSEHEVKSRFPPCLGGCLPSRPGDLLCVTQRSGPNLGCFQAETHASESSFFPPSFPLNEDSVWIIACA